MSSKLDEFKSVFEVKDKKEKASINQAFGCRSPTSKGIGKWDGAFVYMECTHPKESKLIAVFDNNRDFIGDVFNQYQASVEYYKYIDQGWIPMTSDDLKKTANVEITKETNLSVPLRETMEYQFWSLVSTLRT